MRRFFPRRFCLPEGFSWTRWLAVGVVAAGLVACDRGSKDTTDVDQELRLGWQGFRSGEFSDAVARFEAIRAREPAGSKPYLLATYGLATTWALRRPGEDLTRAAGYYDEILRSKDAGELALWVKIDQAEIAVTSPGDTQANQARANERYAEVLAAAPHEPAAAEALIYRELMRLGAATPEAAREVTATLQRYVAENPRTPYMTAIQFVLAQAYRQLNDPAQELSAIISALEHWDLDPRSPRDDRSRVYWSVAILAEYRANRPDIARQYYQKLIDEFPRDNRIFYARQGLERLKARPAPTATPPSA